MDTKQQKTHRPYSEFGFVPNGLAGKRTNRLRSQPKVGQNE